MTHTPRHAAPERFRILLVCTGNLCRSPMAELLLRRALHPLGDRIELASAGTHATPGAAMHPLAAQALTDRGADPAGFRARRLTGPDLARADLVLTAGREHRARCVELSPPHLLRCFTLRQWHRLAGHVDTAALPPATDPARRAEQLRAEAVAVRGTVRPLPPGDEGIPDPLGAPAAAFHSCADELTALADRLHALLKPPVS
ncbi:low molecular weight phosphatase family protein [Dactylosporangium sp. NPDC051541]|uniref:arsenate reductase/protein-tyrosine-phosphatase family protein n=1 Tax=Dactylosporangium sp. NPDC051541 TaxID=3363977 RepID=UPI0037BE0338